MFGATSLVSGLGEEKESRLIEILFSSVSVRQLLLGKLLALGTAGLLQVLIWLVSAPSVQMPVKEDNCLCSIPWQKTESPGSFSRFEKDLRSNYSPMIFTSTRLRRLPSNSP